MWRRKLLQLDSISGKMAPATVRTRDAWLGGTTYQRLGCRSARYNKRSQSDIMGGGASSGFGEMERESKDRSGSAEEEDSARTAP